MRSHIRRIFFRGSTKPPILSLAFLAVIIVTAIGSQAISPYDPNALNLANNFQPPFWDEAGSFHHPLGTDNLGRDILSRIMAGTRVTVVVTFYAIIFSGGIGALLGMVAGYFGGWTDTIIMRLVDIQLSIPALALALVLAAVLGSGLSTVIIVIVVTYWSWYARIIRGEILSIKGRDYIALAKVAGCGPVIIFWRHLLPNILNILLVLASLQIGQVIIFEASLSFLGLGIQMPDVSWGLMLSDARGYMGNAWWAITMPGIAIMLTCLSANIMGDWLRDIFDPKRNQL
ncbi:MAG: ABC transporter permease [Rhizobiales bacterium]|nr:ABC transporter permease [Hyphomicrobiales bacterium]